MIMKCKKCDFLYALCPPQTQEADFPRFVSYRNANKKTALDSFSKLAPNADFSII